MYSFIPDGASCPTAGYRSYTDNSNNAICQQCHSDCGTKSCYGGGQTECCDASCLTCSSNTDTTCNSCPAGKTFGLNHGSQTDGKCIGML